jgi:hypothetical protein
MTSTWSRRRKPFALRWRGSNRHPTDGPYTLSVGVHAHPASGQTIGSEGIAHVRNTCTPPVIRAVMHNSVVDHYGAPAVKSTKPKRDPGHPTRHWWIIELVAQALFIASELSANPELAFGRVRSATDTNGLFDSDTAIKAFIDRVNTHRHHTGLDEIPTDHVTAHMFHRTSA